MIVHTTTEPAATLPVRACLQQARYPGRRGRLAEDALALGEQPVGSQDLLIGYSCDQAAGLGASFLGECHDAGLPTLIAVATVSGSGIGRPATIGAAPAA